jgi:type II secretion system protein G
MVVIFILGLLTTVVLLNVMPSQDRAMAVKAQSDIATLEQALEMFRLDEGTYPSQAQGLAALRQAPRDLPVPETWRKGGYIKDLPKDPWGGPISIACLARMARRLPCCRWAPMASRWQRPGCRYHLGRRGCRLGRGRGWLTCPTMG